MFNSMYDLIQGRREADIFSQGNVDNRPRTLAEAIKEVLKIDYNGKTGSNIVGVGSETGIERRRGGTGDVERGGRGTEGERAADGKGRAKGHAGEEGVAEKRKAQHPSSVASKDNQGNPLNADGTLKLEKVKSVDDLTDEDFSKPTRNVELPAIPKNVDDAIGANGKPIIIKKNIFEKNWNTHKFPFDESRSILKAALYGTDLVGRTQPTKKPLHWVAIKLDEKSPIVVLEVNENKDNVEIVGWYTLDERNLERIKRQAEKNGGELVMLFPKDKVESLSTPLDGLSSESKVTAKAPKKQGKGKKKVEPGQQVDYYSAFAEQYGLDAKKETVANASAKAKEVKGLSHKLKDRYPTSLYLLERDISDMEEMVANGEVSPKRVERVRSEIKRLNGLLADYERLATPEERSWRDMKAEHPDEIVVVDNGNGLLVVCQEDVKATNKAIGLKLDAPVTENLIVTTNEEQGMPFTTMRVTLEDLQRLSDKGVKYVVLDKNGNQEKEKRFSERLQNAIAETETEPTEAQKKAGNYKKGHLSFGGYDFTVETPKGVTRSGKDEQGKPWSVTMHDTYGYILGKIGVDGDHIDMFINDDADLDTFDGNVVVIDQVNPKTGEFDEHKVMYGYPDEVAATEAYLANYSPGWKGLGKVTSVPKATFDKWLESSDRKTKPFREYAMVKKETEGNKPSEASLSLSTPLTDEEVVAITDAMKANATVAPTVEINDANWKESVDTPVGSVKMGENQKAKLFAKGRELQYGMLLETLSNPDVVLEEKDKEQNMFHERPSSYLFVKTFQKEDGSKFVHFESVTVSQEGMEVSISSHIIRENQLKNKLKSDRLLYKATALDAPANTSAEQPIVGGSLSSTGKDTENVSEKQENGGENAGKVRLQKDEGYSEFAEKHGVSADDVRRYAEGMATGNLALANQAIAEIRRSKRIEHRGTKLSEFAKLFAPLKNELYERFGDMDELQQEYVRRAEEERNIMEAARKRAEEEEAKRKQHLEELSLLTSEEIDRRYADAIDKGDDATAREMLDEAARRKGYGDTGSEYQGVGAWVAPLNPGYESDEARRADVEDNAPDVNLEDMALGYNLQPDDYFIHPELYSLNTPHGLESTRAIQSALEALKRGEKDVKVKVYRAVPTLVKEGKLRNGDWVTPSKKYAEMHGNNRLEGKYRIIEDEVLAKDLWWDGNDANEWGYDNGNEYKYKNAKNNRKLNDLVTRDDKGNVILPSKRFNQRKADERYQRGVDGVKPSKAEVVLRDAVIDRLRESGIEVLGAEGQKVLDMANGKDVRLEAKRKRALETASLGANPRSLTAISSADGVKVLKNLDNLVKNLENSPTQPKTFIGEMAEALGIDMKDKSSKYATFECKNGNIVTIRVSDHNATASNLDTNGQSDAISVVITNKDNKGVVNDGDAHIVEFYYNAIKLRKAEGKPLADIANSIKQALYSGEFKDTTGLAEKQEVNANYVREQRVYHGSGADFDHFDHSHMGEGEGAQAYGWGTYVTEVKGIGRTYAEQNPRFIESSDYDRENANEEIASKTLARFGNIDCEFGVIYDGAGSFEDFDIPRDKNVLEQFKDYFKSHEEDFQSVYDIDDFDLNDEDDREQFAQDVERSMINYAENIAHDYDQYWKVIEQRILYTVEIPDDNGENYLDWNAPLKDEQKNKIEKALKKLKTDFADFERRGFSLDGPFNDNAYFYLNYALRESKKWQDVNAHRAISKFLSSLGFVGIKYPAEYRSGGRKDGAKNYVIFNEKDAKITG